MFEKLCFLVIFCWATTIIVKTLSYINYLGIASVYPLNTVRDTLLVPTLLETNYKKRVSLERARSQHLWSRGVHERFKKRISVSTSFHKGISGEARLPVAAGVAILSVSLSGTWAQGESRGADQGLQTRGRTRGRNAGMSRELWETWWGTRGRNSGRARLNYKTPWRLRGWGREIINETFGV